MIGRFLIYLHAKSDPDCIIQWSQTLLMKTTGVALKCALCNNKISTYLHDGMPHAVFTGHAHPVIYFASGVKYFYI